VEADKVSERIAAKRRVEEERSRQKIVLNERHVQEKKVEMRGLESLAGARPRPKRQSSSNDRFLDTADAEVLTAQSWREGEREIPREIERYHDTQFCL